MVWQKGNTRLIRATRNVLPFGVGLGGTTGRGRARHGRWESAWRRTPGPTSTRARARNGARSVDARPILVPRRPSPLPGSVRLAPGHGAPGPGAFSAERGTPGSAADARADGACAFMRTRADDESGTPAVRGARRARATRSHPRRAPRPGGTARARRATGHGPAWTPADGAGFAHVPGEPGVPLPSSRARRPRPGARRSRAGADLPPPWVDPRFRARSLGGTIAAPRAHAYRTARRRARCRRAWCWSWTTSPTDAS